MPYMAKIHYISEMEDPHRSLREILGVVSKRTTLSPLGLDDSYSHVKRD
jgi:hypothetical protein